MTLWHCAEISDGDNVVQIDGIPTSICGVPRAVGMLDCPQCGVELGSVRENGEGPVLDLVYTSEARFAGDREAIGVKVRDADRSGTSSVQRHDPEGGTDG